MAAFASFTDTPIAFMDFDGAPVKGMTPTYKAEDLVKLYRWLLLCRAVDDRGYILVRQGRTGFYAQSAGQEASQIGSAYPLQPQDWIFPTHRELGPALVKGMTVAECIAQVLGKDLDPAKGRNMGSHYGKGSIHMVMPSSTVGNKAPAAVGVALSSKIQKKNAVAVCYMGDGATAEGDTLAALNMAGVMKIPVVFACQNNQYAISISNAGQTATRNFAEKARAFGFDGFYVDGNDVIAVAEVTRFCVERARGGGGPTFIEYLTYRYGPHSSADDDSRYRPKGELDHWRGERDPVTRMQKYVRGQKLLSEAQEAAMIAEIKAQLEAGLQQAEDSPVPAPETVFDHTYATLPWHLERQKLELFGAGV
jgi:TPP-dependent pyruvate/acetoin dehydrogenase alpha subunit